MLIVFVSIIKFAKSHHENKSSSQYGRMDSSKRMILTQSDVTTVFLYGELRMVQRFGIPYCKSVSSSVIKDGTHSGKETTKFEHKFPF